MPCKHRFIGKHIENSLFPDWEVKYLFIGTFNPEWNRENAINANYFYGRSKYFWDAMCIFFDGKKEKGIQLLESEMIQFSKDYDIGFTDLIYEVKDADINNKGHFAKIASVKDKDLETFKDIDWNTDRIITFLKEKRPQNVYFTLLSKNQSSLFSKQIVRIEAAAKELNIFTKRLHTPTGLGLGKGSPRLHNLVHRWSRDSNLPKKDLLEHPYSTSGNRKKYPQICSDTDINLTSGRSVIIDNNYKIFSHYDGSYTIYDLKTPGRLRVRPTLINVILPYISMKYNYNINPLHAGGNQSPKNTQTLAKEVIAFLSEQKGQL